MKRSLQAFMKGILDYAGLFPPASLSLDTSIRNFAQYKQGKDAWMLSRFIIPASRLAKLEGYKEELFEKNSPFHFSVLGEGTETLSDFEEEITEIIDSCLSFHQYQGKAVATEVLEIKLPREAAFSNDVELIRKLVDESAGYLQKHDSTPSLVFYETFLEENWKKDLRTSLKAISEHNKAASKYDKHYRYAGFKIRCGGVEAHMFPEPEKLAFALNRARELDVPVKCTAGLHHPIRHYNESVQTRMHGFFNVFGGAMIARVQNLTDKKLTDILIEEDPEAFSFTDEAFRIGDFSVTVEQVERFRKEALISFGSCSFDEPREDLRKLELL